MAHQGQDRTRVPEKDKTKGQGRKTRDKNREMVKGEPPEPENA